MLSLVVWALILVISVKYLVFILRADNHGEGGILALTALVAAAAVVLGLLVETQVPFQLAEQLLEVAARAAGEGLVLAAPEIAAEISRRYPGISHLAGSRGEAEAIVRRRPNSWRTSSGVADVATS